MLAGPAEIQDLTESEVFVVMFSSSCCEMKRFPEVNGKEKEGFVRIHNLFLLPFSLGQRMSRVRT